MGLFNRPQPQAASPHPIGGVPSDVHEAFDQIEARRLEQRAAELERAGATVHQITRCLPEATLYVLKVKDELRAMTGWRWRWPTGRVEVRYESGFRESPSEWATPRDEGVVLATGDDLEP
jgi:hypothetical protein